MSHIKKFIIHLATVTIIGTVALLSMTSFGAMCFGSNAVSNVRESSEEISDELQRDSTEKAEESGFVKLLKAYQNGVKPQIKRVLSKFPSFTAQNGIETEFIFENFSDYLIGKNYTGSLNYYSDRDNAYISGKISDDTGSPIDISLLKKENQTFFYSSYFTDGIGYSFENQNEKEFIKNFRESQLYKNCCDGTVSEFIETVYSVSEWLKATKPSVIKEAIEDSCENISGILKKNGKISVTPISEKAGESLSFSLSFEEIERILKPVSEITGLDLSYIKNFSEDKEIIFTVITDSNGAANNISVFCAGFSFEYDTERLCIDAAFEKNEKITFHIDRGGFSLINNVSPQSGVNEAASVGIAGSFTEDESGKILYVQSFSGTEVTNELTFTYCKSESTFSLVFVPRGTEKTTVISSGGIFRISSDEIYLSCDGITVEYDGITARDDFNVKFKISVQDSLNEEINRKFAEYTDLFALHNLEARRLMNLLNERIDEAEKTYGEQKRKTVYDEYSDYNAFPIIG